MVAKNAEYGDFPVRVGTRWPSGTPGTSAARPSPGAGFALEAEPVSHKQGRATVQLRHGQKLVGQLRTALCATSYSIKYRTDVTPTSPSAAMTSARTAATTAALTATLGLGAASWVVAVRQMNGMDMGVATRLGSFAFFVALWVGRTTRSPSRRGTARRPAAARALPAATVAEAGHAALATEAARVLGASPIGPRPAARHRHKQSAGLARSVSRAGGVWSAGRPSSARRGQLRGRSRRWLGSIRLRRGRYCLP